MVQLSQYQGTPLLGFSAFSGTGKTTLLEQLIPRLSEAGIRTALIKHSHHDFDIDQPGKDSYRLRKAGAGQMLVASNRRWALMVEERHPRAEPDLQKLLARLDYTAADLVLVEGFRHENISKIELHRPSLEKPLLCLHDDNIIAVASDHQDLAAIHGQPIPCPVLDINAIDDIASFITRIIA